MRVVKLAGLVKELESGARPQGGVSSETGTIPSLGAEHLSEDGKFNFHKNKFITVSFFCRLKTGKIKCNDILIVKDGATTGKVSFVGNSFPYAKAAINEHVFRIAIDQKKGFAKYVYFFLRSSEGKKQILNDFRGATVGGISRQFIESTQIPLPENLDDQIRIANVLTRAETLIAKRKESIRLVDEFLKSTFIEMFGDPVRNEKGWEKKRLGDCLNIFPQNGLYKHQSMYGSGTKIIRIDSFYDGYVEFIEKLKRVTLTQIEIDQYAVKKDDILINRVNSMEYLGKIGIVPDISEDIVYESNMMKFHLNPKLLTPVFLMFLWRTEYIKAQIKRRAKNAVNQSSINQQDILLFEVLSPERTLQNQFADIVEKVEALKTRYTESLTGLEALYASLSQRAFKGELDLSRVPIQEMVPDEVLNHNDPIKFSMNPSNAEVTSSRKYSVEALKNLIDTTSEKTFSFDELWSKIETAAFDELPQYEDVKRTLFEMLSGENPQLVQLFDKEKKMMVMRRKK